MIEQDARKGRACMQIKHALATTSVLALLLTGPVMAQDQSQNPPNGSQPAADQPAKPGGPEIIAKQPPPAVTVAPKAPNVTVQSQQPDVKVEQPPPQVTVQPPQPKVDGQTGQPNVQVL